MWSSSREWRDICSAAVGILVGGIEGGVAFDTGKGAVHCGDDRSSRT